MAGTAEGILAPAERADLARLVITLWGTSCKIRSARVALRRHDYLVALLTLAHSPQAVAIKCAGPAAPLACPFDRTAAILALVAAQTTVPVPTALAHDVSYRDFPWRYLVTTALPGIAWHAARQQWSPTDRRMLWSELGGAVAALHTIRFPSCGEIGPDGAILAGSDFRDALAARAERRIADRRHLATFLDLLAAYADAFAGVIGGTLTHDDLNPTNLLVARDEATGHWQLSGILDFDSAWAANGESDLARLALWEGMTGPTFWASYSQNGSLTEQRHLRRLLLQLLWCLEYAQPTARHHADTRRICTALGIAPITFG